MCVTSLQCTKCESYILVAHRLAIKEGTCCCSLAGSAAGQSSEFCNSSLFNSPHHPDPTHRHQLKTKKTFCTTDTLAAYVAYRFFAKDSAKIKQLKDLDSPKAK